MTALGRGRTRRARLHVAVLLGDRLRDDATCIAADAQHAAETYPSAAGTRALQEERMQVVLRLVAMQITVHLYRFKSYPSLTDCSISTKLVTIKTYTGTKFEK